LTNFNFHPASGDKTESNFYKSQNLKSSIERDDDINNGEKKVLFTKKIFLGDLFHCVIMFYVEKKK
jgi:hypothetical protein